MRPTKVRGSADIDPSQRTTERFGVADEPRTKLAFDAPAGTRIGRYEVLEVLGAGGMGIVYKALDPALDRVVALKLVVSDQDRSANLEDWLRREALTLAKLSHPNIVTIHDVGAYHGALFVAMEFVAGQTMLDYCAQQRSWKELLPLFLQAGRGLAAAHAAGVIHRDIKPENILVGDDGRVRVADFGIARLVASIAEDASAVIGDDAPAVDSHASANSLLGTPLYMAPEQFAELAVEATSDQFSYCISLFEAVYGMRPFAGDTMQTLVNNVCDGRLTEPTDRRGVPRWLDAALRRGLQPDPRERWPSMDALLAALSADHDAALMEDVLRALGLTIITRDALGFYRARWPVPEWFLRAFPGYVDEDHEDREGCSDFLENFIVDAEGVWARGDPPLASGEWTETGANGETVRSEATALRLSNGLGAILVRPLDTSENDRQRILQTAREQVLAMQSLLHDAMTRER